MEDVRPPEEDGLPDLGAALRHGAPGATDGGAHVVRGAHHGRRCRVPVEAVDAPAGVVDEAARLLEGGQKAELFLRADRLLLPELWLLLYELLWLSLLLLLHELSPLLSELRLLLDEAWLLPDLGLDELLLLLLLLGMW